MSGCVNCVWDQYRDELEDWAAKSAEARAALQRRRARGEQSTNQRSGTPSHVVSSMDDDGGGSESLWTGEEDGSLLLQGGGRGAEKLFEGVPIGIIEFMRTEKRLKEKKRLKQTQS